MINAPLAARRPFLLSALLMFLIVLVCGLTGIYVLSGPGLTSALEFVRLASAINQMYEHEIDWDRALDSGMEAMFSRLDRYSGYVEPRRLDRLHEEFSGSYTGIGVTVTEHDDGLLIMSVREDGPASAAGLLNGDIVTRVDSVALAGLSVYESTDVLRGPEESVVELNVYRPVDDDSFSVPVERKSIDFVHIPFAGFTPDSAIYVRILDFDAGVSDDLETALDSLLERAEFDPIGVILDLRGNPGGLFSEAYRVANLFLSEGQFIVGTNGRSRWADERHESSGDDITGGLPLILLVDGGSASSSEIVAGSLQQLGRAQLVGDTTFGKGLVQGYRRLHDGSAIRLTVSRYYLEGDLYLNVFDSALVDTGSGLIPNLVAILPEQAGFVRTLERSLLLQKFANRYQDEIVEEANVFGLGDGWVDRFERFATIEQFEYTSPTTRDALELERLTITESHGDAIARVAARLVTDSRAKDGEAFWSYRDYIKRRLAQLALERKQGSYAAYQKAVVPLRPDIRLATELLRGER